MDKRNLGRFCLQFNITDPRHLQAVEILEAQGRRKAQYITEAILHFVNCKETPEIDIKQDSAALEKMILAIVQKCLHKESGAVFNVTEREISLNFPTESVIPAEIADEDDNLLASIRESMTALRESD
jgi:hypothetical protein